jgi:undecaprenyl-diphosphatase
MSELVQSIILGIVQGLTEFLPISSSAHLILFPWLLGWQPLGLAFDVGLHVGTLFAVILYFRAEVRKLFQDGVNRLKSLRAKKRAEGTGLSDAIVAGTIPAVVVGGLFHHPIERYFRHPYVTVITLSLFGLVLLWAQRAGRQERQAGTVSVQEGLLIGTAQVLALIPGVSRSGITISAALFLGLTRPEAARFSFLLAFPVIALAGIKETFDVLRAPELQFEPASLAVGMIFSFVSGFLCIKYFIRFLEKRTFLPFVVYRFALAAFIYYLLVRS